MRARICAGAAPAPRSGRPKKKTPASLCRERDQTAAAWTGESTELLFCSHLTTRLALNLRCFAAYSLPDTGAAEQHNKPFLPSLPIYAIHIAISDGQVEPEEGGRDVRGPRYSGKAGPREGVPWRNIGENGAVVRRLGGRGGGGRGDDESPIRREPKTRPTKKKEKTQRRTNEPYGSDLRITSYVICIIPEVWDGEGSDYFSA